MYVSVCLYVCMYVLMYVCMYVSMYACVCVRVCVSVLLSFKKILIICTQKMCLMVMSTMNANTYND